MPLIHPATRWHYTALTRGEEVADRSHRPLPLRSSQPFSKAKRSHLICGLCICRRSLPVFFFKEESANRLTEKTRGVEIFGTIT
ncbi:hypothetical protein GDO81_027187 [Engystomops pustulosus]|uniref:Uncharacterized protein n=1 Tax=Engystomops pustulosus TaxID=76066 RepID=A0AAV6YM69_ENGPU|nr:hypothetical protein GDO81_027187 [Engystomops pustulosus]